MHRLILTKQLTKKKVILPMILVVFGFIAFFVTQNRTNPMGVAIELKLSDPNGYASQSSQCFMEDEFSYKYYSDLPDSTEGIQQNIGYKNNKFGLYVYSTEGFIKKADELVNSNGGDWGYVLIPYNVKDYDDSKWRKIFDLLAKKHLIPVIQLWDVDLDDYKDQTQKAAKFLNKFAWPIAKKYVSVYNETNDSAFWKGKVDPAGYAQVLNYTIEVFKSYDHNFFIMNGAFNITAPNNHQYMDAEDYWLAMNAEVPGIFGKLDGWASHPYPQPAYLGKPTDVGRSSIRGYDWELAVLKARFGVESLPIFITETGWPHSEGENKNNAYYDGNTGASYIKQAFEDVWLKDDRVVAIMPFTIYYDPPHDHFSWVTESGKPYPQFTVIKDMRKTAGRPPVLTYLKNDILVCN